MRMKLYRLMGVEPCVNLGLWFKQRVISTFLMMGIGGGNMDRKLSRAILILGKAIFIFLHQTKKCNKVTYESTWFYTLNLIEYIPERNE